MERLIERLARAFAWNAALAARSGMFRDFFGTPEEYVDAEWRLYRSDALAWIMARTPLQDNVALQYPLVGVQSVPKREEPVRRRLPNL